MAVKSVKKKFRKPRKVGRRSMEETRAGPYVTGLVRVWSGYVRDRGLFLFTPLSYVVYTISYGIVTFWAAVPGRTGVEQYAESNA